MLNINNCQLSFSQKNARPLGFKNDLRSAEKAINCGGDLNYPWLHGIFPSIKGFIQFAVRKASIDKAIGSNIELILLIELLAKMWL